MAEADLGARFEAELRVAGIEVTGRERELLYAMWVEHLPERDALRAAATAPEEEPSFIEKPTAAGDVA
jgi:hypothetical protein